MTENEAYNEYVVARANAWAVHGTLIMNGQVNSVEDLDANTEYQAAVEKERAAWAQFLTVRNE